MLPHIQEFIGVGHTKDIFIKGLRYIYFNGLDLTSKRGQKYRESVNPITMTVVDPSIGATIDIINNCILEYFPTSFLEKYAINVASGIEEKGFDYSYGERINRDGQLDACIQKLKEFPETRQGTVVIRSPTDIYMRNPPCMTVINFKVRKNKLETFAWFRSNDALFGWPGNYMELLYTAYRVACEIGIKISYIRTQSESMHYYLRNEEIVKLIIEEVK